MEQPYFLARIILNCKNNRLELVGECFWNVRDFTSRYSNCSAQAHFPTPAFPSPCLPWKWNTSSNPPPVPTHFPERIWLASPTWHHLTLLTVWTALLALIANSHRRFLPIFFFLQINLEVHGPATRSRAVVRTMSDLWRGHLADVPQHKHQWSIKISSLLCELLIVNSGRCPEREDVAFFFFLPFHTSCLANISLSLKPAHMNLSPFYPLNCISGSKTLTFSFLIVGCLLIPSPLTSRLFPHLDDILSALACQTMYDQKAHLFVFLSQNLMSFFPSVKPPHVKLHHLVQASFNQ